MGYHKGVFLYHSSLFINDIIDTIQHSKVQMYVNGTVFYNTISDNTANITSDLIKLEGWCNVNELILTRPNSTPSQEMN